MNGIKYIREKSNFTKNALSERMGVTRQTITLWEKGVRKPDKQHLKWLSDFFGITEKWFGELSEEDLLTLNKMRMYRHYDEDKEYFSFIPVEREISIDCGELESMLDEKYASVQKRKKDFMNRVDQYLQMPSTKKAYLFDKVITAERGMKEIENYLNLMDTVQNVGKEGSFLKVPFRYEIKTALYAMMVASGQYSFEDIKKIYADEFREDNCCGVDEEYLKELINQMQGHWNSVKSCESERINRIREKHKRR